MRIVLALLFLAAITACDERYRWNGSLEDLLRSDDARFGAVMRDPAAHRLQIIYTQIDRDANNEPSFTSFRFRVDSGEYFYPASTVKLPTALVALEKIRRLGVEGLDRDSAMLTGVAQGFQTVAIVDPTAPDGLPSVANYVRKIFLVSDNDAFNRLYEFVGQEPLNLALREKGYAGVRIMHRLEMALGIDENRRTNPVRFVDGDRLLYEQPAQTSSRAFMAPSPIRLGQAEIIDGKRVAGPKDFAEKNALPLQELHDMLLALIFPDSVVASRRFALSPDDYRFVYRYMSMYPGESGIGAYTDPEQYPEGYVKFLMYGGEAVRIPDNIRIFNKVGDAYGFLTDAAYVIDTENGVEFILAATVYTNANQTFNDNQYEYEEIGLPFLRELGQAIYEIELNRSRRYRPDFSSVAGTPVETNRDE